MDVDIADGILGLVDDGRGREGQEGLRQRSSKEEEAGRMKGRRIGCERRKDATRRLTDVGKLDSGSEIREDGSSSAAGAQAGRNP